MDIDPTEYLEMAAAAEETMPNIQAEDGGSTGEERKVFS